MEYLVGLALSVVRWGRCCPWHVQGPRFLPHLGNRHGDILCAVWRDGRRGQMLVMEIVAASLFTLLAVIGLMRNLWIAAELVSHGAFDFVHHVLISNQGVPLWWPGFCLAFDVILGGWLALGLVSRHARS
jgi:hypothetical protein